VDQTVTSSEISALINLLEDYDNDVIDTVVNRLMEVGVEAVPYLEKAWETSINVPFQERVEILIQEIQFKNVCRELRNWDLTGGDDLLKGASIVARIQYPELKVEVLYDSILHIKKDVWLELNDNFTPLEKIRFLNNVVYNIHKFSGNFSNYYAPQNYYVNQVIETHKGNPVTLGIIYLTLAKLLNLPVFGINLPKNFILAYKDVQAVNSKDSILFYINPYNKGAILGKREIDYFLDQQKIEPNDAYYYPCSNFDIIERLIHNLINSYESTGQPDKVKQFNGLLGIIKR
jgi:regulator of sirC expression with transglutaminase-like and TPR domain